MASHLELLSDCTKIEGMNNSKHHSTEDLHPLPEEKTTEAQTPTYRHSALA